MSCGHDPATGKRLRPYETFEGTEYEADLRAMAIKVEHGIVETTSMTVAEYFVGMYLPWAKSRVRTKSYEGGPRDKSLITRETYRGYEQTARLHIIPLFGHIGLSDLKPYYVEQKLAEIPSLGSRRNAYKLLRQGYRRAVKWQLLQFVVTDAVEEPTADPVDKPTVKSAEMWDYIDAFDEPGDEDVRMAVAIGFGIGLRRSEIAAIDKEEIDWTVDTEDFLGAVRIWRSYHFRKGEGWFEPPKSFTSARTLFPAMARRAVAASRRRVGASARAQGRAHEAGSHHRPVEGRGSEEGAPGGHAFQEHAAFLRHDPRARGRSADHRRAAAPRPQHAGDHVDVLRPARHRVDGARRRRDEQEGETRCPRLSETPRKRRIAAG